MKPATKLSAIAAVSALCVTLAGCGAQAPESSQPVDLRMTVWTANEAHLALFAEIADEYVAEHPEVASITFDALPFEDYTTTLITQIAGGTAPDLAWIFEKDARDFVDSGALYPLTDTLAAVEGYELDDLNADIAELWIKDDQLLAYPFSTSPTVMFVNEDLLAAAGLPSSTQMLSDGNWDWMNVAAAGSAVNAATGSAGFVIRDFEYRVWLSLGAVWRAWDARPWNDTGTECTFDSEAMVGAFEFVHRAAFETNAMPGPGTSADFFAGDAAFTTTQISRASLLDGSTFEWNVMPLPAGPAVEEYSAIGQAAVGVINAGENPAIAADFLAFYTNPENSRRLSQFFPPPRDSQLNGETLAASNPMLTEQQLDDVVVPAIKSGTAFRPLAGANAAEVEQVVRAALDPLWVPDGDVRSTLGNVCDVLDDLADG